MEIISIKIALPSKSKAFVVFAEEIQRLEIAYKNNHFEWRKTRLKTKVEATCVIVILYLQLVVFS